MTEIELNGEKKTIKAATLAELVEELELADAVVATALNAHFVPKGKRAEVAISQGDRIEILSPMQGG